MPQDNQRAAASMKATLSGSVIAGAFAVFGGVVAITTFTVQNKEGLFWFTLWAILSAACLAASMVLGAKGISQVFLAGYDDQWEKDEGKGFFSAQAGLGTLGLILAVVSVFCGRPKLPQEPPWAQLLDRRVTRLEQMATELRGAQADLATRLSAPKPQTPQRRRRPKKHP